MSAHDHLSELQFEAHRGIIGKLDPKYGVGMHFSASPQVATRFASRQSWNPGTVIHARVPLSSLETDKEILGQRGFAGFEGKDPLNEQEIPVRQGAPILVTGRTTVRKKKSWQDQERKTRTRTYNPPRIMYG